MNISETNRSIATKFYLTHHLVGGKAALSFWPDPIRALVSIAAEISPRVIMEQTVSHLFLGCFSSLHEMMTCMRARTSLNFGLIGPLTAELAAL